jgi:hypothetical protein
VRFWLARQFNAIVHETPRYLAVASLGDKWVWFQIELWMMKFLDQYCVEGQRLRRIGGSLL